MFSDTIQTKSKVAPKDEATLRRLQAEKARVNMAAWELTPPGIQYKNAQLLEKKKLQDMIEANERKNKLFIVQQAEQKKQEALEAVKAAKEEYDRFAKPTRDARIKRFQEVTELLASLEKEYIATLHKKVQGKQAQEAKRQLLGELAQRKASILAQSRADSQVAELVHRKSEDAFGVKNKLTSEIKVLTDQINTRKQQIAQTQNVLDVMAQWSDEYKKEMAKFRDEITENEAQIGVLERESF